jgi:hypothetical protein
VTPASQLGYSARWLLGGSGLPITFLQEDNFSLRR